MISGLFPPFGLHSQVVSNQTQSVQLIKERSIKKLSCDQNTRNKTLLKTQITFEVEQGYFCRN